MINIIRFTGSTCGPCRMQRPLWLKLQEDFKNDSNIKFSEIVMDTEEDPKKLELCRKLNLKMVPTIVAINENDEVLDTIVGFQPYKELCKFITKNNHA